MKILVLFFNMLIAVSGFAKELTLSDWQRATVKVNSHSRLWNQTRFSGSGILVLARDRVWVITSEHVLYNPGTYDSVIEIPYANGIRYASFVASDYLKGMAVLELNYLDLKSSAIPIEELSSVSVPRSMTALGYPVQSDALQTLSGGDLKSAQSPRALIPGIRWFLEVDRLPVEYGMSGGALLSTADDHLTYAGMISHQFLKRQMGQPTQVRSGSGADSATAQDLLLAIPANEVVAYFNSAIQQDKNTLTWTHVLNRDGDQLKYGPLTFSVMEEGPNDAWKIGGGDGGGDGGGVGGGDGAGVGGDKADGSKFQSVRVLLDRYYNGNLNLLYPQMQKWISWLKSGREVRILYLRPKQGGRLTRTTSVDKFLTAWLRDGEEPVAVHSTGMNSKEDEIPLAAGEVVKAVSNAVARANSEPRVSWLMSLRELAVQAEAGMASSRELTAALGGANTPTWESYYNENFDGAVALEGALEGLVEKMKALGL